MKISVTARRKYAGKAVAILQKALRKHEDGIQRGMEAAVGILEAESLNMVPRDTGALADSVITRTDGKGLQARVYCAYGPEGVYFPGRQSKRNPGVTVTQYPFEYALKVHENGFVNGSGFLTGSIPLVIDTMRQVFMAEVK